MNNLQVCHLKMDSFVERREPVMIEVADLIRKKMTKALHRYQLIEPHDKVMVCVSGGKDSTVMLLLLEQIRKIAPFPFSLHPVLLDQNQPGFCVKTYQSYLADQGFDLQVLKEDTYSIVIEKTKPGKSFCGLCSRLRRGIFYTHAQRTNMQKIALGHHQGDVNETLLLNLFYNGKIAGMPAKLVADDQVNTVIRPLVFVAEDHIIELAQTWKIPTIPCNLCGNQKNMKRQMIKKLIADLKIDNLHIEKSLIAAQQNIRLSQLLG